MNEYKITFTLKDQADTYSVNWVERTEAAARRAFLKNRKEMGSAAEVSDIELIRDDACATKAQERETLEAIKKMVAELGPQSYLATAFEGCFEDAEQNIEDDAAYSMKARLDIQAQRAIELGYEVDRLKDEIKRLELDNRDLRAAVAKAKEEASKTITSLREQVLSPDDLEDVRQLLEERITESEEKAEKAAQEIVKYAEDPTGKEFAQAVADHRNHTKYAEYHRELLGRVVAA